MNCLPCLRGKATAGKNSEGKKSDGENSDNKEDEELLPVAQPKEDPISKQPSVKNEDIKKQDEDSDAGVIAAAAPPPSTVVTTPAATDEPTVGSTPMFKFQELASATKNFNQECLLGESGFGKVYKGTLAAGKVVAVKKLERHGTKANKEFIEEVIRLSELRHPNLVELIGYCADDDQILLVYEYMPMGSVKDHLHDLPPGKKPLDWITRLKAAAGAAEAIKYLHEKVNPPVICRNIKSTNVLLDQNFEPKLADYGLLNLESSELSLKSDIYNFGVILLELISGRKPSDTTRPTQEQNLVSWAQPNFNDPKRFQDLADPMFKGVVPEKILNQAVGVAAMCLTEDSGDRPLISEIVGALSLLTVALPEGFLESPPAPELPASVPPKNYPSSSSSTSSSGSDSEHELDFKIEPFNRPEPQPQPQPDSDHESDQEQEHESDQAHEWEQEHESDQEHEDESDPETDYEPEPEPESEPEPEPEPDLDTDSDSDSDSEPEPEPKPEPEPEQVSKSEPVVQPEALTRHNDEPNSDNDSISTSGSIYDEDAYSEENFSDEEKPTKTILINSKSKARTKTKSTKKKVMFKPEEPDLKNPNIQRVNSTSKHNDDQSSSNCNNQPIKRRNTRSMRKSESRGDDNSDIEFSDGSDDEFGPQRFKSTISRFNAESRCYSAYQDDESVHGSSSEGEK